MGLLQKEMGLNLGIWKFDKVLEEIRRNVRGYNVPLPILTTGGAAQAVVLNGSAPTAAWLRACHGTPGSRRPSCVST